MDTVNIAPTPTGLRWTGATLPTFVVEAADAFISAEGVPVNNGRGPFRETWTPTLDDGYLVLPDVELPPTENSSVPSVLYYAYFLTASNDRIPFSVFGPSRGFRVPASPTSTTWEEIDANMGSSLPLTPGDRTVGNLTVTEDADIAGDLGVGGNLAVAGSGTFGSNVQVGGTLTAPNIAGNVSVAGNVTATQFNGSGAGLTGVPSAGVGGSSSLGSLSVIADSDNTNAGELIDFIFGSGGSQTLVARFTRLILTFYKALVGVFYDKGGQVWNVMAYGADNTGALNSTGAIQNAIDACAAAGGGIVFLPAGTFSYTALTVPANYVRLKGTGRGTRMACSSATGNGLSFDNGLGGAGLNSYLNGCGVEDVRFEPSVTRTSGYEIYAPHFTGLYLHRLAMYSVYGGILIGRSTDVNVDAQITELRMYGVHIGVKCINSLDMMGRGWVIDNANTTADSVAVWLSGGCEGANVTNFDFVNSTTTPGAGSKSIYIYNDAGVATPARYNKFAYGYPDGGAYGAWVEDGWANEFFGVGFHGWTDSALVITGTAANTKVIGGYASGAGSVGVYVNTAGAGTLLEGVSAFNNGQAFASPGIQLAAGAQNVTVNNCRAGRDPAGPTPSGIGSQNYALQIDAGVSYVTVTNNDFYGGPSGHTAGALNILSTEKTLIFSNNWTEHGLGDAVAAWRNSNQSVPNATQTDILFNVDLADPANMHDEVTPSPNFYAWVPGFYMLTATVQFATSSAGYRQVTFVRSDGTVFAAQQNWTPSASAPTVVNCAAGVYLTAGQYVKVLAYQTSGGALNIESGSQYAPTVSLVKQ